MNLDLVDDGCHLGLVEQPLQVRDQEVGDSDRAGSAIGVDFLERPPGLNVQVLGGDRPVDQIEVDVVLVEPAQALVECPQRRLVAVVMVGQLGGDEYLFTRDAAGNDGLANAGLVLVAGRGVDAPIPAIEGCQNRRDDLAVRNLKDPEAQLWHLDAVVERDARHDLGHSGRPSL